VEKQLFVFEPPRKDHLQMPETDAAQKLIEEHIDSLGEQKAQLERALAHLNGSASPEGRSERRGRGAGTGSANRAQAGAERAPRGARRGEVIADLKANPGSKAGEVASRVGINPNHAQTILGNLVKQGVASKQGRQYTLVAGRS
jgi:predicted transcriptional regulator